MVQRAMTMEIPFHRAYITEDEVSEVVDSIRSGWITMGPKTVAFEERFRDYIGSAYAVSMNSCTACLHLALRATGLREGDEVIVPSVTFTATAEIVTYFKAHPVVVDVDYGTHNISVEAIEKGITSKTRAIIPVHYAGQPCDLDEIYDLAGRRGLAVVEDAAHALPAFYKGRRIGAGGDITCFSFYATKSLTTGEGGMATTGNPEWAELMKVLRLHGISKDAWKRYTSEGSWYYEVVEAGYKYNMTDIQAGLGLAQLRKIDWMWERRKEIAQKYAEAFRSLEGIDVLAVLPDRESAWHLYVIRLDPECLRIGRNEFIEHLKRRGISASVHFIPLHRHPYYRSSIGLRAEDFPVSEKIYDRIVSLPIYPGMTDDEVRHVAETVGDLVREFRR